jgi:hypothetical protein
MSNDNEKKNNKELLQNDKIEKDNKELLQNDKIEEGFLFEEDIVVDEEESLHLFERSTKSSVPIIVSDPRLAISLKHFLYCIFIFFKEVAFEIILFFSILKRLIIKGFLNLISYRKGLRGVFRFFKRIFYVLSGIALVYYCILCFLYFIYFCYYLFSRLVHVFIVNFLMLIFKNDPLSITSLSSFMIKYILPFDFIESEMFLIPQHITAFRIKYFSLLALVDKVIDVILYLLKLAIKFRRMLILIYIEL